MRFFRLHGSGEMTDTLTLMNIHLHYMTAKKGVQDGARALKLFFDEVVEYIIEFRVRIVSGDFNMAMWMVVPEFRARGLQADVAAWYPWRLCKEEDVHIDSCMIITIGGCAGNS